MRSATLVTALTSLTTAMAVTAPMVVFGFLYFLQVQPERAGAVEARTELDAALVDLNRRRAPSRTTSVAPDTSAVDRFVARAGKGDRMDDLVDALTGLLSSSAVGGVSNLRIETGASRHARTPVTTTFDARYEQIVRFVRTLGALPAVVSVQSVEIEANPPSPSGLTRAKVLLLVSHPKVAIPPLPARRGVVAPPAASTTQPAPIVSSILIANGRRVARVDGRIVGAGDRLGAGVVQSIEPDAIVLTGPDGKPVRIEIEHPANGRRTR